MPTPKRAKDGSQEWWTVDPIKQIASVGEYLYALDGEGTIWRLRHENGSPRTKWEKTTMIRQDSPMAMGPLPKMPNA